MTAVASARAVQPATRAAAKSRRPMAWPTRTLAAAERPMGIIKVNEMQLRAISWPGERNGTEGGDQKGDGSEDEDLDEDGCAGGHAEPEQTGEGGEVERTRGVLEAVAVLAVAGREGEDEDQRHPDTGE